VYIGDSITDILTAKNAGIDCIIVKWGYGLQKDFEDEYLLDVIDDFEEIVKYF
jgi:phosphoglycolate phosphatase